MKTGRTCSLHSKVLASLAAAAAMLVSQARSLAGQTVDLSIAFTAAPATASAGTPVSYVVQVGGSGGTNVWVMLVFSLGTEFNAANQAASSAGCVGSADTANPGTTVSCPWSGSAVTVNVTPRVAGTMKIIASVVANQLDTNMFNNSAIATTTVSGGSSTPTPTRTSTPGGPTPTPTATPTRTATPSGPTPTPGSTVDLFGALTPASNVQEGPKEVGEEFYSSQPGSIVALRFWKSPSESGSHAVSLWDDAGTRLASVTISAGGGSGWQEQPLSPHVSISANRYYVVSYTVNSWASETSGALFCGSEQIVNFPLTTDCAATNNPGQWPFGGSLSSSNYFADIQFLPGAGPSPTPTRTPTPTPTRTKTPTPTPTRTPPAPPTGLTATAISATQVSVSWNASPGATSYQLERRSGGGGFAIIASPTTTSYTDTVASATAYVYRVKAVASGAVSAPSNMDLATTVIFVDDPIAAGVTVIQAQHINQLRQAVNAVRACAGMAAFSWTDPTLAAGMTIRKVHVDQLRSALTPARSALGFSDPAFTDPTITAGQTPVKKAHIDDLRQRVK